MKQDWEILEGKYSFMLQNLKVRFPHHLSIVRYGNFYQIYDDDATFFENYFSFNSFVKFGKLTCGFPTFSTNYFDDLRNMKKSFIRVDQLPDKINGQIVRAISEIYTGRDSDKTENDFVKVLIKINELATILMKPRKARSCKDIYTPRAKA